MRKAETVILCTKISKSEFSGRNQNSPEKG